MKWYNRIVLEANDGIDLFVSEKENGEIVITAVRGNKETEYSENYTMPPIPEVYKHVSGKWNNGVVIEREFDNSQFVWISVGCLKRTI